MYLTCAPILNNIAPTLYITPPSARYIKPINEAFCNSDGIAISIDQPLTKWHTTESDSYLSISIEVNTIPRVVINPTKENNIQPKLPPTPSNTTGIYVPKTSKKTLL